MSLSMLCVNFKLQDSEQGKVHKWPAILFVPDEDSTEELDKVEITLRVLPNATGGDAKNNITKNCVAKFKLGNPEELINWRIQLNHTIWNKPCKLPESWFNMVEMLLGGEVLQHWRQFKSQTMGLPILGVLDGNDKESSGEDKDDEEKRKRTRDRVLQVQALHRGSPKTFTVLDLGIRHVVAQLREINSMLPYFPQPSISKLPEDKLVEIVL
eukprot:5604673-Ditylum_brightwellii.AAC.1